MTAGTRVTRVDEVLARRQPDLTVLAESLHKPRNFSAIVRTCDSVGVNSLHAVPGENGLAIHWKTSQGAEKWVDVQTHDSVPSSCAHLKKQGFRLVAANLSDSAKDYRTLDYTLPTALVVGTELFGCSAEAISLADEEIMIPMMGMTQSLNVSVACSIVLYEAMRQRQEAGQYEAMRLDDETSRRQRFEWLHPKVAEWCRSKKKDYPPLDDNGDLTGKLDRDL
jgi:tRNA (guanosine-2'-O-)-methyltransferase